MKQFFEDFLSYFFTGIVLILLITIGIAPIIIELTTNNPKYFFLLFFSLPLSAALFNQIIYSPEPGTKKKP